jgi:hypothetical protein
MSARVTYVACFVALLTIANVGIGHANQLRRVDPQPAHMFHPGFQQQRQERRQFFQQGQNDRTYNPMTGRYERLPPQNDRPGY